jgi:hypothetical protein
MLHDLWSRPLSSIDQHLDRMLSAHDGPSNLSENGGREIVGACVRTAKTGMR